MTFIAGYIYKNSANIIADSAITSNHFSSVDLSLFDDRRTSFGERTHLSDEFIVTDSAQKIFNIDDKFLISFSGENREGLQTIRDIKSLYKTFNSITAFLKNFFEGNPFLNTYYIVAYSENNLPYLYAADEHNLYQVLTDEFSIAVAGADPKDIRRGIRDLIEDSKRNGFSIQETLQQAIVSYQMISMSFRTLENGVGGFWNGAYVADGVITWAEDACYFLASAYNLDLSDKLVVMKFNRNNNVVIINSYEGQIFYSELETRHWKKIWKSSEKLIKPEFQKLNASFYIFLLYDTNSAIILNHKKYPTVNITNNEIELDPLIQKWSKSSLKNQFKVQTNFTP